MAGVQIFWPRGGALVRRGHVCRHGRPGAPVHARRAPVAGGPIRVEVSTLARLTETGAFAISPDGRHLVFAGSGADGVLRLWVRSLDASDARPLPGTEVALGVIVPPMFWSPDSRFVAFDAIGQLKKVDVTGGSSTDRLHLAHPRRRRLVEPRRRHRRRKPSGRHRPLSCIGRRGVDRDATGCVATGVGASVSVVSPRRSAVPLSERLQSRAGELRHLRAHPRRAARGDPDPHSRNGLRRGVRAGWRARTGPSALHARRRALRTSLRSGASAAHR